jgi:hypothetical protein
MESSKEKLSTWTIGAWFVSSEVASLKRSVTSFHCPEEATAFDIALSIVAGTLSTLQRLLPNFRTQMPQSTPCHNAYLSGPTAEGLNNVPATTSELHGLCAATL